MTAPNIVAPSKPLVGGVSTSGSQRDRRFTDTFWDTFKHPVKFPNGRPWTGERELRSGSPYPTMHDGFITSDLQQGAYFCENPPRQTEEERRATITTAWTCPWVPLAKYFRFNPLAKRITFALDKMIADENEGAARWWEAAAKMAGDNDDIDHDRPKAVPFRIKRVIGDPLRYTNQIRLAQAMQAADPWLVGFTDAPNEELAKILRIKVAYVGARGSDSAEAVLIKTPDPTPPLATPEHVLSLTPVQLQEMIAEASKNAATNALAERDRQEKEARDKRMAELREKKKQKNQGAAT